MPNYNQSLASECLAHLKREKEGAAMPQPSLSYVERLEAHIDELEKLLAMSDRIALVKLKWPERPVRGVSNE